MSLHWNNDLPVNFVIIKISTLRYKNYLLQNIHTLSSTSIFIRVFIHLKWFPFILKKHHNLFSSWTKKVTHFEKFQPDWVISVVSSIR